MKKAIERGNLGLSCGIRMLGWLLLFVCNQDAVARFVWQDQVETYHCDSREKVVHALFNFQNVSAKFVAINQIKTSCGCTLAGSSKRTYAPYERGFIDVTYDVGDQTGPQVKSIAVRTDEPGNPIYMLSLVAYLPEPLKIAPRYVYWEKGGANLPQLINLAASSEHPVKILSVSSNNPTIEAALITNQDGQAYSIQVKPTDTKNPTRGMLTIVTDLQLDGKNRRFFAYADVRADRATVERKTGAF